MKRLTDDRTMEPGRFIAALAALGWKQTDFARRTGLNPGTVTAWVTGKVAVPLWAGEYLGTLVDLAKLHEKHLAPVKAPVPARLARQLEGGVQDADKTDQAKGLG